MPTPPLSPGYLQRLLVDARNAPAQGPARGRYVAVPADDLERLVLEVLGHRPQRPRVRCGVCHKRCAVTPQGNIPRHHGDVVGGLCPGGGMSPGEAAEMGKTARDTERAQ